MYHFEGLCLVPVAFFAGICFLSGLVWLFLPVCSLMVGDLVRVLRIAVCFAVAYAASVPIRFAFPFF
jgi:hypothetical protein